VLAGRLGSAGYTVLGLDSAWFERWALSGMPVHPWAQKDIRDLRPEDVRDVDAIVHLAALSNDPLGELDPDLTEAVNVHATVQLARHARAAGVRRFVFASSCSVYGAAGDDWVDETTSPKPLTPYALSKVQAERALQELASTNFSPVALRLATLYGFSPSLRLDLVANNLAVLGVATKQVLLRSDGSAWRPLLHVEDAATAILKILEAPSEAVAGEVFNVGSDAQNYQVRDVAEAVCRVVPGTCVRYASGAGTDPRSYRVSFRKFTERFPEAAPRRDLMAGLEAFVLEFSRRGLAPELQRSANFERIQQLRWLRNFGLMTEHCRWKHRALAGSAARVFGG